MHNMTFGLNISCISAYEHSVCQMVSRMLTPKLRASFWRTSWTMPTWQSKNIFHNSLFRMIRRFTTLILSQNKKKHAMEQTNRSKFSFYYTA